MENLNDLDYFTTSMLILAFLLLFFGVGLILFLSKQILIARNLFSKKYIERKRVSAKKLIEKQLKIKPEEDTLSQQKKLLEKILKIKD